MQFRYLQLSIIEVYLYVFSEADAKPSFPGLSGNAVKDKASLAADRDNIPLLRLISIGGNQLSIYEYKTVFNESISYCSGKSGRPVQ